MINEYINNWIKVIEQMNNDNTYKLAWGRAILECVSFDRYKIFDNDVIIDFTDISECMIKYYWNQLFFFNLKQAPYKDVRIDWINETWLNIIIKNRLGV